jgi:hypothetical protein
MYVYSQALIHADRDRALVRRLAVWQVPALWTTWILDNIVWLGQRRAGGLDAIFLRCGGRARGCHAVVVGREAFRRGSRVLVVIGSRVHRYRIGVI